MLKKMRTNKRAVKEIISRAPKKLKPTDYPQLDPEAASTSNQEVVPSSLTATTQPSTSSTKEDKIECMDREAEEEIQQGFRFSLIGYMPNPAVVQSNLCREWNIPNSTRRWDIADYQERKFISLEILEDVEEAEKRFLKKAVDIRENAAMVVVGPISLKIVYTNLLEKAIGESKVRTFLTERRANMKVLGLMETELSFSSNLDTSILCSPYGNEWCTEWLKDCCTGDVETNGDNVIYNGKKVTAANVSPNNFLQNLDNLEEDEREDYVKWRGKTLTEGFVSNIITEEKMLTWFLW